MGPSREKLAELEQRMEKLGILSSEIEERFIKSSGRGGQKVNKTSSAVFLKHLPTGITVKCGSERSQTLNRFLALRRLADKIEEARTGAPSGDARARAIRKQKSRRHRRSRSGKPGSGGGPAREPQ